MNTPTEQTIRIARDPLVAVTCVFVMLATAGFALDTTRQYLAASASGGVGDLEQSSFTNAEAAHITLTNLHKFPVETCLRAIVSSKSGHVTSVPVCTGRVEPRTTRELTAPYQIGAVQKLCAGQPDQFGLPRIDWDRCSFTLEAVP